MSEVSATVKVNSTRFGEQEFSAEEIISFPEGLLGFAEYKRYVLIADKEAPPFIWLQSLEEPSLAFLLIDPLLFMADYQVEVKNADIALLELESLAVAKVLTIVTVRERPQDITANLQGPLVINPAKRVGKQVVLLGDRYSLKQPILEAMQDPNAHADRETG